MRRRLVSTLVVVTALAASPAGARASAGPGSAYVGGRVIVRFKPFAGAADRRAARRRAGARVVRGKLGAGGTELLAVRGAVDGAIERLDADHSVAYAEPDYRFATERTVNDPLFPLAWDLLNTGQGGGRPGADIDVARAWDTTMGAGVTVGIVDSGVDFSHPDLRGAAAAGSGWNIFGNNGDLSDHVAHGTHVAGIVAARANNRIGSAGVAPLATLVVAKVANDSGQPDAASLAAGLAYVADRGARVVNMSIGGSARSKAIADAIARHPGTLYVVSAGNDGANEDGSRGRPDWPCAEPAVNLICVAASDRYDMLPRWSNYGVRSVDLAAPGDGITSTAPRRFSRSGYLTETGTSMAAPHVAGAAALLFAADPGATVAQVKAALLAGAVQRRPFLGRTVSGGRLDVYRSLIVLERMVGGAGRR